MSEIAIHKVSILGATGRIAPGTIEGFDKAGFKLRLFSRSIQADKYPSHETIKGDVFNESDLNAALQGSDAVHISLAQLDEYAAVERIIASAKKNSIKLISYVSGATVRKENTALSFIDAKYKSERLIKSSGIPYMIYRPTWFMESLPLMIQDGKANVMGKQPLKLRWIAARDFGALVAKGYQSSANFNQEFNTYGPEGYTINEALEKYIAVKEPSISKVANAPFGLLKAIAFVTRNKQLKEFIPMFEYFEKTKEAGSPETTERLLGKSHTTLDKWLIA